jgi:type I site-specific restriction-modification system R (restriction) subunit
LLSIFFYFGAGTKTKAIYAVWVQSRLMIRLITSAIKRQDPIRRKQDFSQQSYLVWHWQAINFNGFLLFWPACASV